MSIITPNRSIITPSNSIISANSSVIASSGGFVYPAGRIGHYPMDTVENTLGTDCTNVGGTFLTDPEGIRGTVWQGDGVDNYLSSIQHNVGGSFWSGTLWFSADDISSAGILFGSSIANDDDIFNNSSTEIGMGVGGTFANFTVPSMSNSTSYMLGVRYEQSGSDVLGRLFLNGIESSSGELTFANETIGQLDQLGKRIVDSLAWSGEFSICNTATTLWTPTDFLNVYNHEVLPQP